LAGEGSYSGLKAAAYGSFIRFQHIWGQYPHNNRRISDSNCRREETKINSLLDNNLVSATELLGIKTFVASLLSQTTQEENNLNH